MQGINTVGSPQRGVIPRSFEHIFEASSVAAGTKYLVRASYLEIYNEAIRDLLSKDVKATLDLKEYVDKGVQVQNLTWHQCTSVYDCEQLMEKGNRNRATGATLMNKDSSRSHSIFTLITEICNRSELDGKEHIRAGKLNLVDLAGSERQSKTQAEGERLREATRINLSLSALGNVISALVDGRSKHIPYRDSKLTRLLQDSLGGNTKTLMIAAISPAHDNYDETLSTLRYANRAKNIKNKPRVNEDPLDAQMKLLQEEINRLKQELMNAGQGERPAITAPIQRFDIDKEDEMESERQRLREQFEREVSELRRQCDAERLSKEELEKQYAELRSKYDSNLETLTLDKDDDDETNVQPDFSMNLTRKSKKKSSRKRTDESDPDEKLQRLQQLEKVLIGGEDIHNEERKRKRKKQLNEMKEKQERRKQSKQNRMNDDEDAMLRVFDNAQEELQYKLKQIERESFENKRLLHDNDDLQYEFERDRENYLNIIREQDKQLHLYKTMMNTLAGLMKRNCSYNNPERVLQQARYDEERNEFIIPDALIEEIQFPQVDHLALANVNRQVRPGQNQFLGGSRAPPAPVTNYQDEVRIPARFDMKMSSYQNSVANISQEELERRYGRSSELLMPTTRNKRQEQLLNENSQLRNSKVPPLTVNNQENDYMNRRLNPFEPSARLGRKYGFSSDKS